MTTTTTTVAERVAAGAAWLDEHEPGWVADIDLDRLLLSSPCRCVLGQLYGSYYTAPVKYYDTSDFGFAALAEDADQPDDDAAWDAYEAALDSEYAQLDAAWRELIATRRAVAAQVAAGVAAGGMAVIEAAAAQPATPEATS
jgi:hypothetical protein